MKPSFKEFFKPIDTKIKYNPEELKKGIKVEKEHTTSDELAEIIAKHHLAEDEKYYTKLSKWENKNNKTKPKKIEK